MKYHQLLIYDADLQYPVENIIDLLSKLSEDGLDIVIGSRTFKKIDHFKASKKFFQIFGSFIEGKYIIKIRINNLICIIKIKIF